MKRPVNTISIEELPELILAALRARSQTAQQLADQLGFAPSTIRSRLSELLLAERVYFTKRTSQAHLGTHLTWHIGAGKAVSPEAAGAGTVRVRRDPLVAALFGPASARAANG